MESEHQICVAQIVKACYFSGSRRDMCIKARKLSAKLACKNGRQLPFKCLDLGKGMFLLKFESILREFRDPTKLLYSGETKNRENCEKIQFYSGFLNLHITRDWKLKKGMF